MPKYIARRWEEIKGDCWYVQNLVDGLMTEKQARAVADLLNMMMEPKPLTPQVKGLAILFCKEMRKTLSDSQIISVNARNKGLLREGTCASHDFCDAYVVMANAFRDFTGRESDPKSQTDTDLWTSAWDAAKAVGFEPADIL